VPGRHVRAAGERLDVQRLRVLPVDPVPDAAQPSEVAQALRRGGCAGHMRDLATSRLGCLAPLASYPLRVRSGPVCAFAADREVEGDDAQAAPPVGLVDRAVAATTQQVAADASRSSWFPGR
jgi:hypothetical protein